MLLSCDIFKVTNAAVDLADIFCTFMKLTVAKADVVFRTILHFANYLAQLITF